MEGILSRVGRTKSKLVCLSKTYLPFGFTFSKNHGSFWTLVLLQAMSVQLYKWMR